MIVQTKDNEIVHLTRVNRFSRMLEAKQISCAIELDMGE